MFKVRSSILYFLLLILIVLPNLISDDIYKQPKVFVTLLEEGLKFILGQKILDGLILQLVLIPAKASPVIKEKSGKEYLIKASGTDGGKIILTLLAEVVILYVGFFIIEVWESGFEQTFSKTQFQTTRLCLKELIPAEFCNSLKVFFSVSGKNWSKNQSIWGQSI